ncbi:MAG TPA: Trk system potassium transporter TrkA [Chloroflexota bacterium]|nr:Trk system potassium transporter TrkA [Chloroflexota bacterium]
MKVIVVGAGIVGYNAALLISQEGHDVVVVEQSQERIDKIHRKLDVMTVSGSGTNPKVMKEAGVDHADLVVAATDIDEVNMVACFVAKQMGAGKTVARLRKEEYITNGGVSIFTSLGIDHVITPEVLAAEEIADVLTSGSALAVEDFGAGKIRMMEYKVGNTPIDGMPLKDVRFPKPCKIVAIVRPSGTVIPRGNDSIRLGDHIYIVTSREDLADLEPFLGLRSAKAAPDNITIFGVGRIGLRLAKTLERHHVRVKAIEQNLDRCELAASELKNARVICGDERDLDLFREEAVPGADAFVAITAKGDLNILMALLAKQMGVARTIAVFNEPEYQLLADNSGIDVAISPLLLTAGAVLKFVRRSGVQYVALLEKQQAEALELMASPGSAVVGKPLKDAVLPPGAIVGAILRNGKAMVPDGSTPILSGDRVVVVTLPGTRATVERLFSAR